MLRQLLLLFSLILCTVSAAQDVSFTLETDALQVVVGNYFEVSLVAKNGQIENISTPEFKGFDILSGPNRSSQMTIINGKTSRSMSIGYGLASSRAGTYTLGPIEAVIDGKRYTTNKITVEVLTAQDIGNKSSVQGQINTDEIVLEAQLSYDQAFIGQQLLLKYVLYTTQDVRQYNFLSLPDFNGFFAKEISNYRERPKRIVRDGKQYIQSTIKVIALYPQQKGVFSLDPATAQVGVSVDDKRSRSFFFNTRLKPVRLSSESVTLSVIDLPDGAPLSFSGGVGKFSMKTSIDRHQLTMDDALTLTMQIQGDCDGKLLRAPVQPFADLFEVYEPNLLKEESQIIGDRIITTKTFEYLMIPRQEGTVSIDPELSYFDVDSSIFVTITDQVYNVEISPSTGRQTKDLVQKIIELPPYITETRLQPKGQFFLGSGLYYSVNVLLVFGILGLFVFKYHKNKEELRDPAEKKFSRAYKIATRQLQTAENLWKKGQTTDFYIELRRGMLDYLASKAHSASSQLTKTEVTEIMTQLGCDDLTADINEILTTGERAIYASISPGKEAIHYKQAIDLIKEIESRIKKEKRH